MTRVPDDEREDLPDRVGGSMIPGAWAQPASAFVDESHVVRPDRSGSDPSAGRVRRLLVLAAFSLGTAGFAWGVTVALQGLDDEEELTPAQLASIAATPKPAALTPPSPKPAAVRSVDEAEGEVIAPAPTEAALAASEPSDDEAGLPVPAADPTFPHLPAAMRGAEDEAVEPQPAASEPPRERLRPAQRAYEDDRAAGKKQRYRRMPRKGQRLATAPSGVQKPALTTKPAPAARGTSAATAPKASTATSTGSSAAAPQSAASLTLEAEKLFASGQLAPARALAERAVKVGQAYPRAHRTLAVICAKQGDGGCARKGYERYLLLAPDAPDAPDVRRILGM